MKNLENPKIIENQISVKIAVNPSGQIGIQ